MKQSGIVSSQRGIGHARINRALAMLLCLLMLLGLMPTRALAALADGEAVISVSAPAKLQYEVDTGTELKDVSLPGELSVSVLVPAAEEGGERTTREEPAAVKWAGDYDKDQPGSYALTATFTDGYSFDGSMPTVTVTVLEEAVTLAPQSEPEAVPLAPVAEPISAAEPEAVPLTPEKLNVNADDSENDLAKVPDFYTPVLEKEEDTETALFSFTDQHETVQYRIYGSCGELVGFFVCKQDGKDPVTSDTVNESKDRALLPAVDALPAAEPEPALECTCDPKPGEGEAHQEGCPLYAAPEPVKECTCDPKPGEGEAHLEGCPLYAAPEPVKECTCDPKPGEGEAHLEGCPLYTAPEAAKECTCGAEAESDGVIVHAPICPLYVAPSAPLSEKADAFVQAVNALDSDAILAAVKAHVDASAAADAEPDNAELKKVAAEAKAAMEAATAPIAAAFELYGEVPLDELEHEQVVAALNKLNELATAIETTMNAEPTLLGTLGGTAPKLGGDWAYLTKFEILDDPTTTVVEGIMDGSGPFDTDTNPNSWTYKDRQGNDESDQNGKVRSFDTITYKLNYATTTSGEYDFVKEGWMNYEMVLPYAASRAVWQTDSMAWVGTKVADQAALDVIDEQTSGYYLATETREGVSCQIIRGKFWIAPNESNPYAIPGEGTLSAVVQVLAMEEGDEVKPRFSGWMEHNTTDQTTCGTHHRDEIINFTARSTTVTAEVRMDIELAGDANSMVDTIDFSAAGTSASAPNYDKGSVVGKPVTYNVGVYLGNSVAGKGRKGIMAPKSGDTLTFDLTLSESVTPTSGTAIDLNATNYRQLLWAFGSNDGVMDWYGRPPILGGMVAGWLPANTAFDAFTVGNNACYNGGIWSYSIDSANPNVIHVTVSGMEIDLANYPHTNISENRNFDVIGAIPVSSGQMTTVFPIVVNGTNIMEDTSLTGSAIGSGTIAGSIVDSNMSYTYVSKTDNQPHTLTNAHQTRLDNDWSGYSVYAEKGGGTYDCHVMWSNAPIYGLAEWIHNVGSPMGDTTGGKYYLSLGGDPVVRNQSIGSWFGFYHQNDVPGDGGTIVAGNSLLKFDSNAVTPTGNTVLQVTGYTMTALYATKQDGTAWASDDEMETTSMTALKYYSSLSAIPSGHKCVAVLTEYRPTDAAYTGVPTSRQHLYSDAGFTVNAGATEGALYQCTIENYAWSRDAYEALGKNIPSLLNSSTLPAENWHWQPDYDKGYVDASNGHLVGDTSGFRWGDVMQIICGRSRITKEVAQMENGTNKSVYYMDSDQRFVDYKLNVSTEYVTYNVVPPTGVTTTLTIMDTMPSGIEYVPNSAYYGGTYAQNSTPGRQGTVTGGTPLTLINSWTEGDFTWYKFEIKDVKVGDPLLPIYLTAKIGTRGVEATDVQDTQHIKNYAISQIGKEITVRDETLGLNQGFAEIIISKNGATSRSKLADQTYIENGDAFNWTINIGNNGGSAMPNTLALDTLPYVNDGQGTAFTGTLSLSKWNVDVTSISNFTADNWKVMYTEDINVRGTVSSQYAAADVRNGVASGPNGVVFKDITTLAGASINYATGVVTLPASFRPTAMVVVGTLPGNQTMKIAAQMKIADGKQGDILVNQLDGYPSPIYVVKRSIEGCTWLDTNYDGIRQDSETMLPGVTATLLKLKEGGDATKEADYAAVKDSSNNVVKVETGKQKDAVTGAQTGYDAGRYQFTNLTPGTYAVRFESGTVILDNYTASPVNKGTDDAKDSDATPTYNAAGDKLEQTLILGIVMAKANDQMKDINQASRNNDSGLYLYQFALTVSKTVATGSQTKDFTFTVYLANGTTPLTGKFDYTGSAISGVDKPKDGSITLSGGSAEITLKHGQSIIIAGIPAGTTYTVTEQAPGTGWTITAPATGSSISGTLNGPAVAAFSNSYKALNATYTVPALTKTLTGTLHTGFTATFSASIAAVSTTASGLNAGTMPMPPKTTVYTPAFITTGTQSFASFGSISYSVAGKYVYRITENTSSVAGVTCDKSEYTLTVDVTDVNGQLTAAQTIAQTRNAAGVVITNPTTVTAPINFANSYAPKSTAVTVVTPAKQLSVTEGNALPENYSEKFTATITAATTGAPMPANASVNTDAFTATGNKAFASFGSITFTAAGTYEYTIKESTPATATPGMTYDKSEYKLSVEVVDDNGQLKATPTYTLIKNAAGETVNEPVSGIVFTNRYTPTATTLTSGAIKVRKTLSGDVPPTATAFSFTLKHTPTTEGPAAGLSIAAPTTISTAAITQGTNVPTTADFGTITFNRVGTYTFTVTETPSGVANMADAAPQTVYVKVTDNAGQLAAAFVDATGTPVTGGGELTFTNTYTRPMGQLVVSKTVTGGGNPNALFTFRFTFSEATRYAYTTSGGTTGTVATGESLQLKHGESVTITIHHNVTYMVVEDAYMSYIPTPIGRTFMGTIGVTESRADYMNVFDLPYIPPTPTLTGNLTVQKTVTGDLGDRSKYFAFKIVFHTPDSYYYTGSKTGMIASGDTILLKHGEYITIVNLPAGTTYSVTESGNSGYRVYASGDVGIIAANRISVAAFTNSRSRVPITGDDGSLFQGLMLMLISLVGGAVLLLADQRLKRRRRRARAVR